jgi:hypothetical protein
MEQKAIIRFFTLKGLKAKAIQAELESVYGTDACKLSTVTKRRLGFVQGSIILFDDPAEAVGSMPAKRPLVSCNVLYRHFRIAKTTCLRIVADELGLQKFHLRWVTHLPPSNQKSERVTYSNLLLEVLEEA